MSKRSEWSIFLWERGLSSEEGLQLIGFVVKTADIHEIRSASTEEWEGIFEQLEAVWWGYAEL